MNRSFILFSPALGLLLAHPSEALMRIGNGEVILSTSVTAEYESHIEGRASSPDDMIYRLDTTLNYTLPFRYVSFSVYGGYTVERYDENREFDDDFFNLGFDVSVNPETAEVRTDRFILTGDVDISSSSAVDEEIGELVTTRTYSANANLLYDASRYYNMNFSLGWSRSDPQNRGDQDLLETDTYSASAILSVPLVEGASLEAGATAGWSESDRDSASTGKTYTGFVGWNGPLSPKVFGSIRTGATLRETDGLGDDTAPYLSANLSWLATDRTTVGLSANNSFGSTLDDRATETFSLTGTVSHTFHPRLSGSVFTGLVKRDVTALEAAERNDTSYTAGASLNFDLTRNTNLSFNTTYAPQDSNDPDFDYERWTASLTWSGSW